MCVFCDSFLCSISLLLLFGSLSYVIVYYKCECSCTYVHTVTLQLLIFETNQFHVFLRVMEFIRNSVTTYVLVFDVVKFFKWCACNSDKCVYVPYTVHGNW